MLSNAYFLAKFRFDTAENEPAKNLQNFADFPILLIRLPEVDPTAPKRIDPSEGVSRRKVDPWQAKWDKSTPVISAPVILSLLLNPIEFIQFIHVVYLSCM